MTSTALKSLMLARRSVTFTMSSAVCAAQDDGMVRIGVMSEGLDGQRNLELDAGRRSAPWRQIEQLRLAGIDDLHHHDVRRILEFQVEVMELGDVRAVDPDVVLIADPSGEARALHRLVADVDRRFQEDPLREIEMLERVLPALLIGALGRSALPGK